MLNVLIFIPFLALFQPTSDEQDFRARLQAASKGNAEAQNELGIMYAEGDGIKQDNKKAVTWFRKSAEQGNAYAACNLGLHYLRGEGVRRDKREALKWVFVAHSLDSLNCHPEDFFDEEKLKKEEVDRAWNRAMLWLRRHPDFKNDFGEQPWFGAAKPK